MFAGGQRVLVTLRNGGTDWGVVIADDDPRVAGWSYVTSVGPGAWVLCDSRPSAPYYIRNEQLTAVPPLGY